MKRHGIFLVLATAVVTLIATGPGWAGPSSMNPPIPDYGKTVAVAHAGVFPNPNLDYKVVMSVTKSGEGAAPPAALQKAARLVNLLAESGVRADHRHIVVVLHGAATTAVMTEAATKARGKGPNPSADLIAKLTAAGVRVDVCGQALAAAKIARSEVLPEIQVDLSALTTLATLQLEGYALIPD